VGANDEELIKEAVAVTQPGVAAEYQRSTPCTIMNTRHVCPRYGEYK
jgi:hypothetical protein